MNGDREQAYALEEDPLALDPKRIVVPLDGICETGAVPGWVDEDCLSI